MIKTSLILDEEAGERIYIILIQIQSSALSPSSVAGRDGDQPVGEDSSLSGTGRGEETSLGAGEGVPEEESQGERGGAEEGRRRGERRQGEETRL